MFCGTALSRFSFYFLFISLFALEGESAIDGTGVCVQPVVALTAMVVLQTLVIYPTRFVINFVSY